MHQHSGRLGVAQRGQQVAQFGAAADELADLADHHALLQHRLRLQRHLADAVGAVEQRQRRTGQEQGWSRPFRARGERIALRQLPAPRLQGAARLGQRGQRIGVLRTGQRPVDLRGQLGGVVVGDGFGHRQHRRHPSRRQLTCQTGPSPPLLTRVLHRGSFSAGVRSFLRSDRGSWGTGRGAARQHHQRHDPTGGQAFRQKALRVDLVGLAPLVLQQEHPGAGVAGQVQDMEPLPFQGGADLGQAAPVQHPHIRAVACPRRVDRVQDPAQLPLVVEEFATAGLRTRHHRQNPQRTRHLHRHRSTLPCDGAVQLDLLRQHQGPCPRDGQGLPRQVHPLRVVHRQSDPQRRMTRPCQLLLLGQRCRHLTAHEPLAQRLAHSGQHPGGPSRSGHVLRRRQLPRGQAERGPVARPLQQPQPLLEKVIHTARPAGCLAARGGERHHRRADP